ncbi:MAG: alpha-L-fucosidase [Lentisphaeria bacterium]
MDLLEFSDLRYGLFVHYGLYSQLARGEWVMNREKITPLQLREIALRFQPSAFAADEICRLALAGGMKYLVFTTMHHEGFRLYRSALSDFNSWQYCERDLVRELVESARAHGLKLGLYHSLNNWYDQPDAVAALEDPAAYQIFIEQTFARLQELLRLFTPIDIFWYDGWWPFSAEGWQAERMNQQLRQEQPNLLFNGRNGLPGDFRTPEGHLTAPDPWHPWEACMTLNQHWGYHAHDNDWKSPREVIKMLLTCSLGKGNLLLNIGPRGDGSIPAESIEIISQVGSWLRNGGEELLQGVQVMPFSPGLRQSGENGDWDAAGPLYAKGQRLYWLLFYCPGSQAVLTGLEMKVREVRCGRFGRLDFVQSEDRVSINLPPGLEKELAPVLVFECDRAPSIYRTGGMRVPKVPHPRYDPVQPDIKY